MKVYTQIPITDNNQVKAETISANLDKYMAEFNGRMDSNNMPVLSVQTQHLATPEVPYADTAGDNVKYASEFPSQSYHWTTINNQTVGNDIWTPTFELDLDSDSWSKGFMKLPPLDSRWDDWQLNFDSKEGMLIGCATVDWEHGNQVFDVATEQGNALGGRGYDWWTEWAVFVNNVMVARTGWIYPRRHSTQIPFSIPCGSQNIEIDVRCRVNTWRAKDSVLADETTSSNFYIWSTSVWVRNHYR